MSDLRDNSVTMSAAVWVLFFIVAVESLAADESFSRDVLTVMENVLSFTTYATLDVVQRCQTIHTPDIVRDQTYVKSNHFNPRRL